MGADRDRARVRDVGQQRAEQDGHLDAERLGQIDDRLGERAPAEGGLGAGEQDQVARGARDADGVDLELRPVDRPRDAVLQAHHRARGLEVDELLGVDPGEGLGAELPAMKVSAEVADSPASFQPLNAQTSAGARRPSGRRSQRTGCIADPRYRVRVLSHYGRRVLPRAHRRRPACRRPGRRGLRLLAQGPPDRALGHAVSGARAARPDGRDPGPRVQGRGRAGGALRARRPRPRRGPGRALPRRAADRRARDRPR